MTHTPRCFRAKSDNSYALEIVHHVYSIPPFSQSPSKFSIEIICFYSFLMNSYFSMSLYESLGWNDFFSVGSLIDSKSIQASGKSEIDSQAPFSWTWNVFGANQGTLDVEMKYVRNYAIMKRSNSFCFRIFPS